jgi:ABC-type Fe3+ transport system permease subunit
MPLQLRTNPKTTGWQRRGAIALLIGLAAFTLSLLVSFFFFLNHFNNAYPRDTQNLLSALTASVVLGLVCALLAFATALLLSLLLRNQRAR